jgi:simple sugar transport system substrate-binding protein
MSRVGPTAQLAAVTHHWGGYYTQVAEAVLAGRWKPQPAWGGMKDGMVKLAALHPSLPKPLVADLQARRDAIVAGRLQPFAGRLVDNQGRVRLERGALDDRAIAAMDWFVEGVSGSVPAR